MSLQAQSSVWSTGKPRYLPVRQASFWSRDTPLAFDIHPIFGSHVSKRINSPSLVNDVYCGMSIDIARRLLIRTRDTDVILLPLKVLWL